MINILFKIIEKDFRLKKGTGGKCLKILHVKNENDDLTGECSYTVKPYRKKDEFY